MRTQWRHLRRAARYFRPDAGRIVLAVALLLVSVGANLLKPWPIAWAVDHLLGGKPWPAGWAARLDPWSPAALAGGVALAAFLLHGVQAALSAWHTRTLIQIGLAGLGRVRGEVFQRLQRLSWRQYHQTSQGDLIYRASWDVFAFQTLFQHGLFSFLSASLSLALMFLVMSRVHVGLALLVLATVPLLLLVMRILGRGMSRRSMAAHQADSELMALVQQGIAALPLIQSYRLEPSVTRRYEARNQEALARRGSQHSCELAYLALIAAVFGLGVALVLWRGTTQVAAGQLTVGGLVVFLAYLGQFYDPLNQLSHVGTTVAEAFAGTQRVFELLDTPDEVRDAPDARPVARRAVATAAPTDRHPPLVLRGGIRFERVSFAYQPGPPVLREVTLDIAPGEALALIGPSGAGKSTLIHLVPRFFDPSSGTVALDGVDVRQLRLGDLREHIALVMQEPVLLPGTVAENIACGLVRAGAAEIEAAARDAHAHEFIARLPQGYQTVLGDGAARLSTGEKQRLNLARAFLKNAPILILDEPTSGLDADNEALVVDSLRRLMPGRTTLIVAHRLATLKDAHRIVTIEAGRITEAGAPTALLAQGGYYARALGGRGGAR